MEIIIELYQTGMIEKWLVGIGGVILAARTITTLTPNKSDDKFVDILIQILNKLSLAIGKNNVNHIDKPKSNTPDYLE